MPCWTSVLLSINDVVPRILDIFHTIFVDVTLWDYLILHFGDLAKVDSVSWYAPKLE